MLWIILAQSQTREGYTSLKLCSGMSALWAKDLRENVYIHLSSDQDQEVLIRPPPPL